MRKERKFLIFELTLIALWGLVPLLWFMKDALISTVDLGLPLSTMRWSHYLYAWDPNILSGVEWTRGFGFLTFKFVETLVQFLGFSMIAAEKVSFLFWFVIPGLSLYYLMQVITREKPRLTRSIITLVAVNFYMFNLFLESLWRGNRSGLSAYAFAPLVLALFIKGLEKKKFVKYSFLIALFSIFLTAAVMNQPIISVWIMAFVIFYVFYILRFRVFKDKKHFLKSLGFCSLVIILSLLVNLYAILPNFITTINEIKSGWVQQLTEISSNWVEGTSFQSSFYNVIRMQASWTWYQGWKEPYHTYSTFYQTNHFFIILSWLIPSLVLYALLTIKNKYKWYFFIIVITSLILSMGTHWPFTRIYRWMMANIPFFIAFRSPWYKFSLLTCLGYAYFLGFGVGHIYERLRDYVNRKEFRLSVVKITKKAIPLSLVVLIVALNMLYAFPVVTGKMFAKPNERQYLWADHVKIPDYVLSASEWLNEKEGFFRIITVPTSAQHLYLYCWHYVSNFPVLYKFIDRPVLFEHSFGDTSKIVTLYYEALYSKRNSNLYKILNMLNTDYIVHELDNDYNLILMNNDSPEFIKDALEFQNGILEDKSFGSWNFYHVEYGFFNELPPYAYLARKANMIKGEEEALIPLSETVILGKPVLIFSHQQTPACNLKYLRGDILKSLTFYNNSIGDLTFDLIDEDSFFDLKEEEILKFKTKEDGLYQFWVKADINPDSPPKIVVDGIELKKKVKTKNLVSLNWHKLGSYHLKVGQHTLKATGASLSQVRENLCVVKEDNFIAKEGLVSDILKNEDLNLVFLTSTRNFAVSAAPKSSAMPNKINIIRKYGFSTPKTWEDGREWSWLRTNAEVNFLIENLEPKDVKTNFCFTAYSPEILRGLQVIINDDAINNVEILPDNPQEVVVKDIILKEGVNTIKFFTAHQWSHIDGKNVRFAFLDDFRFMPLCFTGTFYIPKSQQYKAQITPNSSIVLKDANNQIKKISNRQEVFLEEGEYRVELIQKEATQLYDIGFVSWPFKRSSDFRNVNIEYINPTKYKLDFKIDRPYFLVFNESYHPQWKFKSKGKGKLEHIKINGFANGWYVEEPGSYSAVVKFSLQDLFYFSLSISAVTVCFIIVGLVRTYKRKD